MRSGSGPLAVAQIACITGLIAYAIWPEAEVWDFLSFMIGSMFLLGLPFLIMFACLEEPPRCRCQVNVTVQCRCNCG
jgi:hypothetical protein